MEIVLTDDKTIIENLDVINKKIVSGEDIPSMFKSGLLDQVITLMKNTNNQDIQHDCVWILVNITAASIGPESTQILLKHPDVVPLLQRFLTSDDYKMVAISLWCVTNMMLDESRFFEQLNEGGIFINRLYELSSLSTPQYCRYQMVSTFIEIVRLHQENKISLQILQLLEDMILPMITRELNDKEITIVESLFSAVNIVISILKDEIVGLDRFIMNKGLEKLCTIIYSSRCLNLDATRLLVECFGKITLLPETKYTRAVISCGLLELLPALLNETNPDGVQQMTAWTISNIAGDGVECIAILVNQGVHRLIISLLMNASVFQDTKDEAACALCNMLVGCTSDVEKLVQDDAIRALAEIFNNTPIKLDIIYSIHKLSKHGKFDQKILESGLPEKFQALKKSNTIEGYDELFLWFDTIESIPSWFSVGQVVPV